LFLILHSDCEKYLIVSHFDIVTIMIRTLT